jgi:HSP20 family protein
MKHEIAKTNNNKSMLDLFFGDKFYDDFFTPTTWRPAVDIAEKDGKYVIKADLPGVEEKDVSVEVHDGVLTIKGERKSEFAEEKDNVYRAERSYGAFMRSFTIGDVNEDKINAEYKNGTLTIELPKTEQKKAKKISIKSS